MARLEVRSDEIESSPKLLIQVFSFIATIMYAAIFTIPGDLEENVSKQGIAVMGNTIAFYIFLVTDSVGFTASMCVFVLLLVMKTTKRVVLFSKCCVCVTATCAALTFLSAVYLVQPSQMKLVHLVVFFVTPPVLCSLPFICLRDPQSFKSETSSETSAKHGNFFEVLPFRSVIKHAALSDEWRNSLIQMFMFIATVAFTARFTIPAGLEENDRAQGIAVMVFCVSDTVAFLASLMAVVILVIVTTPIRVGQFSKCIMWVAGTCAVSTLLAAIYLVLLSQRKLVQSVVPGGTLTPPSQRKWVQLVGL